MSAYITIVSGLPRSGTSMMMRMLDEGGIPIITDRVRAADEDNPRGYYEFEPVKALKSKFDWLIDARGKAVKIVSRLLLELPTGHYFRIVFMRRHLWEILASQQKMLHRRGIFDDPPDNKQMACLFRKHLEETETWLRLQKQMQVIYVSYNDIISDPKFQAEIINRFLDKRLCVARMVEAVDSTLYRQRLEGNLSNDRNGLEISPPINLFPA